MVYIDNKIMSTTFCKINVKHVKDNKQIQNKIQIK